jgi:uncharacterized protein (DUF4415 family)
MSISKKRIKKIASKKDSTIDYSEIAELDESFWKKAKLVEPETKQAVSLRLDSDILKWFKKQGKGYQSLINAVLKTYVQSKSNDL